MTSKEVSPIENSKTEAQTIYNFEGKLNDKIPVSIWFVAKDSVVKGEVVYLNTRKRLPINLLGTATSEGYRIHEFKHDGSVTGTYIGQIKEGLFKGSWYAPESDNELPFALQEKDTLISSPQRALDPKSISGAYRYQFGKKGAFGSVDVKQLASGKISVSISCVTDGPAYNLAELTIDSIGKQRNSILYKMPDENCAFRIRFFNDFLTIDYVDHKFDCGFGQNATVDGVFIKTK